MPRKIRDSVVVITGASSGIGRATALAFAREGATTVLAARRQGALEEVARECERLGGRALVVPTDVSDEEAVQQLARSAIEHYGRIDVWVNNAAVTLFGRFEETPPDLYRQVIETNLFGDIYGARAVLPYFREQGSGTLVLVGSVVSKIPWPYASSYVISKRGVAALGESLRQELMLEGLKDIHVCTVMPATIDTPLFQHAGNYVGRVVKALPPVYPAKEVADTIVDLAKKPQREVLVGNAGKLMSMQNKMSPGAMEVVMAKMVDKQHFGKEPAPPSPGNVLDPMPEYTDVSGGWKGQERSRVRRLATAGALLIPAAVIGWRVLQPRITT